MKKIKEKLAKNKPLSIALILCLTVAYLLATSSFAQDSQQEFAGYTTDGEVLDLFADKLSYGDLWTMSESEFKKTYYAQTNTAKSTELYNSKVNETSTTEKFPIYSYYGYVKTGDHSGVDDSSVPLNTRKYADFWNNYTFGEIEGVNQSKIPCASVTSGTKEYASYATVPDSIGTYRVYVYTESADGPSGKIKYSLVDNYKTSNGTASFAGTAFTATNTFTAFTQVGQSGWWYADVTVSKTDWNIYKVSAAKVESTAGSETADEGGDTSYGTLLGGDSGTYYYNKWTVTEVKLRTLLVVQWNSEVKLGPITKMDTIAITADGNTTDTYGGALSVQNIFGQAVTVDGTAQTTPHAPLFVTATAGSGSVFGGFEGVDLAMRNGICEFLFDHTMTVAGLWENYVALPVITVTGDGYSGSSSFYSTSVISPNYTTGVANTFTIFADFANAPGTKVRYRVLEPGAAERTGTFTASDDSLQISVKLDTVVVILTAVSADEQLQRICTVTITSEADTTLPLVAKNSRTGIRYRYIEDAIAEAQSGDMVILTGNATFVSDPTMQKKAWLDGDAGYTIDAGVTLLLPYSRADYTIQSGTQDTNDFKHANAAYVSGNSSTTANIAYSKNVHLELCVPAGITIKVANGDSTSFGRVVIGGTLVTGEGGEYFAGATYGAHANLELNGTLQLGDYAVLSVTGYVYGDGTVETTGSSAEIYQPMVIRDWRGAGVAPLFVDSSLEKKVTIQSGEDQIMPFTQWSTFNIQTKLRLNKGNYMLLYAGLRETDVYCSHPVLIGDSTKTGLIILSDNAYLVSEYNEITWVSDVKYAFPGKTTVAIYGGASLGQLILDIKLSVGSLTIDTSDFTMNVSYGYDVELHTGSYAIEKSVGLLPGVKLTVAEDATLSIGSEVAVRFMVYDGLLHRGKQNSSISSITHTVEYAASRNDGKNYPTTAELQASSIGGVAMSGDAEFIVDGKLVVGQYASFGGVVQTTGFGEIDATEGAAGTVPSAITQIGVVGTNSVNLYNRYFAGMVLHERTAQLVSAATGERIDIVRGNTYYGVPFQSLQETYSFKYYAEANNVKNVILVGDAVVAEGETATSSLTGYTLNETIYGGWCIAMSEEVSLDSKYYLEDYVWLNGVVDVPVYAEGGALTAFSLDGTVQLPMINGKPVASEDSGYYVIRQMEAKSLSQKIKFRVMYTNGDTALLSNILEIDFQAYADEYIQKNKDSTDQKILNMVALVTAMKTYGDAAEIYFTPELKIEYNNGTTSAPTLSMGEADVGMGFTAGAESGIDATLKTNSAKVYFDEALRMSVFFTPTLPEGFDTTKIVKIGLLASPETFATTGKLTVANHDTVYVLYSQTTPEHPGGSENYPAGNPELGNPTTDYSTFPVANDNGRWELCFDLTNDMYNEVYEFRPFMIVEDENGTHYVYGEQVHYSLAAYVSRTYTNSTDKAFKNLLVATWDYVLAADAAF